MTVDRGAGEILIEFPTGTGLKQVARGHSEILERSSQAVDSAMEVIRSMADRVRTTVDSLQKRPDTVEIEFGVVFDSEANAMVAKIAAQASITVTIGWAPDTDGNAHR